MRYHGNFRLELSVIRAIRVPFTVTETRSGASHAVKLTNFKVRCHVSRVSARAIKDFNSGGGDIGERSTWRTSIETAITSARESSHNLSYISETADRTLRARWRSDFEFNSKVVSDINDSIVIRVSLSASSIIHSRLRIRSEIKNNKMADASTRFETIQRVSRRFQVRNLSKRH